MIQHCPTSRNILVQLLRFKLDILKIVAHLMKAVGKSLSFHQSQSASSNSAQSSENRNTDMRVDASQTTEVDEHSSKQKLKYEQYVGEDVEDAILGVNVFILLKRFSYTCRSSCPVLQDCRTQIPAASYPSGDRRLLWPVESHHRPVCRPLDRDQQPWVP